MDLQKILAAVDHTLLKQEATWADMQAICDEWFAAHPDQKRVVVMPDGGNRWYRDSLDDSSRWLYQNHPLMSV